VNQAKVRKKMKEQKELTAAQKIEAKEASEQIAALELALSKEQAKQMNAMSKQANKRLIAFCKSSVKLTRTTEQQLAACKTQAAFIDCCLRMKKTNAVDIATALVDYHFYKDVKLALRRVKRHFNNDVQSRAISRNAIM
jgi:short subunit dehydrogenase-like uncharacterized protein